MTGWIIWGGGKCPVPQDTKVQIRRRDGWVSPVYSAAAWAWEHGYGHQDVVEYFVVHRSDISRAEAQHLADSWNRSMKPGAKVTYLKSELEGKVILATSGPAKLLDGEPVVELEHIGSVLLNKVSPFFG